MCIQVFKHGTRFAILLHGAFDRLIQNNNYYLLLTTLTTITTTALSTTTTTTYTILVLYFTYYKQHFRYSLTLRPSHALNVINILGLQLSLIYIHKHITYIYK